MKESIFKNNNQINSTVTTRTWVLSTELIRTWPSTGLVLKRNKSNKCINSAQIKSKVADVKWPKETVAIVGDSIMSGIRVELRKTDKHNVKVSFLEVRLLRHGR